MQNHGNKLWFSNIYIRELGANTADRDEAISPTSGPIKLFNGKNLEGLYTWLPDSGYQDPRNVFSVFCLLPNQNVC